MVIVTKRVFIIAEKLNYVSIDEEKERYGRKTKTKYTITIRYVPVSGSNNNRHDVEECTVMTYVEKTAHKLYAEIVQQYREQNPDQVYLDKIAEQFLGGNA